MKKKKEKKKRADLNIMCDTTKQYMHLIVTFINVEVHTCLNETLKCLILQRAELRRRQ